ncbi:MAG: alpha-amylase family glycosyl hydrolase, partial [Armatimonadota bacterium]
RSFAATQLDRIAQLGYDTLQLMAVQEHPYYASFGYHVSSFFAPTARFGTPDDLRGLIREAHARGIAVWMDLVHSHAVTNVREGINRFDGTEGQFFHTGPRGYHPSWDSRLFDYGNDRVVEFLLSNLRYWIEEFGFDGFRFDGVTSMLYRDHGIARTFGSYDDYFGDNVDEDALRYLQAANELVHELKPGATTSAEDVSGMPGLARPVAEGGLGFDFRMAMGLPDAWGNLLRDVRDEQWLPSRIQEFLLNRRPDERHVAYLESHDQCIVGDQSFAFRLMGDAMYTGMSKAVDDPRIDRGIALHKLMRLLTFAAGGEAWLTFLGNEFGHPEWVDLPREGNHWSVDYARRQWGLARDPSLRYGELERFEQAMLGVLGDIGLPGGAFPEWTRSDDGRGVLAFHRGGWTFVANLHPERAWEGVEVPVARSADHRIVLNTDATEFGGFGRGALDGVFAWFMEDEAPHVRLYLPNRTALVLAPVEPDSVD